MRRKWSFDKSSYHSKIFWCLHSTDARFAEAEKRDKLKLPRWWLSVKEPISAVSRLQFCPHFCTEKNWTNLHTLSKKMQIAQISNKKIVTVVTLELSVKEPICAVCISIWNICIWIKFLSFNGPYQPIVQQMIDLIKANLSQVHLTSDVFFSGIPFSTLEKK